MFGRLFSGAVGAYLGVVLNQNYILPQLPAPTELLNMIKAKYESFKNDNQEAVGSIEKILNSDEMKSGIEKVKDLEEKFRK